MSFPDKCPNCGSVFHRRETSGPRIFFACGSWIWDDMSWPLNVGTDCHNRRKIRDAESIIRAFLDGDRDAREKGFNWIAENTP